jgi:hypothetical protein
MACGELKSRSSIPSSYGENYQDHDRLAQMYAQHHRKIAEDYDDLVRRMNHMKGSKIDMTGHASANYDTDRKPFTGRKPMETIDSNFNSDDDDEREVKGGKFHFAKSMKSFGKSVGNTASELGSATKKAGIQIAAKEIATEGIKQIKNYGSQMMSTGAEVLPEALPVEVLAAGIKQRRRRIISPKEANRHALIRNLMNKYNCTLAEASKHIKENNLNY